MLPVLGRPERAQSLVDNLFAVSQPTVQAMFLCSPGDEDEVAACRLTGVSTVVVPWASGRGDYARKINEGFRLTESPFVLCGADDIVFHERWDIVALQVAMRSGAGVIGTNDLHSPFTRSGAGSTHPLVRRTYIEEEGGCLDSGTIYAEVYDHQWVDRELAELAQARGQWAFAKRSVVEHLHPHWGKGQDDATYRKGAREVSADQRLYMARRRHFGRPPRSIRRLVYS